MSGFGSADGSPVRAGLRISVLSLIWTLAVGGGSLAVGLMNKSLALASFGAVGLLDAIGSASLVIHFVHARSRDIPSPRLELMTLRIVTVGLAATGVATAVLSVDRLAQHGAARTSRSAVVISALSVAVLTVLAIGKQRIAARIPSRALHADSWVSAVGAALAVAATVDVIVSRSLGWWWADSVAATVVSVAAIGMSAWLLKA